MYAYDKVDETEHDSDYGSDYDSEEDDNITYNHISIYLLHQRSKQTHFLK